LIDLPHSYGGIFERGSREYTLDDFYSIQLDKMDRFICLKKSEIMIPEGEEESSSSDEDDEDDSDEDDSDKDSNESDSGVDDRTVDETSIIGATEAEEIKRKATSREKKVVAEELATVVEAGEGGLESLDVCSVVYCPNLINVFRTTSVTKLPHSWVFQKIRPVLPRAHLYLVKHWLCFMLAPVRSFRNSLETLNKPLFHISNLGEYWTQKAVGSSDNKGKQLRRDGFALAEE